MNFQQPLFKLYLGIEYLLPLPPRTSFSHNLPVPPALPLPPAAGLFDASKEIERLEKQRGKVEKELAGLEARLANKKFVDKVSVRG